MENFSALTFRKMTLEDVFTFRNWGRHDSILFLEYNFLEEREKDIEDGFRKIILFAATYNERAIKVYESLGFKEKNKFLMRFTNGNYDENNPDFKEHRESFKIIFNRTYNYAIKMELDLERDW